MVGKRTRRFGVAIIAVLLVATGTAIGVAITSLNFNPLEPGQGAVPDSSLVIESENLTYSGLDATGANLDVNNTDSVDHTGDVHLSVLDSGGSVVASATQTGVSFPGNGTVTTVSMSFSATNVSKIDSVEVRIDETG